MPLDEGTPEHRVSKALQEIACIVDDEITDAAGVRMGWSLVVFNHTGGGRINYISSCDRAEVVKAFEALLHGWKEGMPDVPGHEVS